MGIWFLRLSRMAVEYPPLKYTTPEPLSHHITTALVLAVSSSAWSTILQLVLEKTLESPLDSKDIKPVNLKGNHLWIFTGKSDAEAEVPIFQPPDAKRWFTGKDPDTGKDWGRRRRVHREWDGWMASPTQGHEFEQTLGDSQGQRSLACCNPWGCKESDMTSWLDKISI